MSVLTTSSQTVGPYLRIGFSPLTFDALAADKIGGERIAIRGRLLDGDRKPVSDGVVEIWQANAQGKYASPEDPQNKPIEPGFRGFGRIMTDDDGAFRFTTVKPGLVPGPGGALQAPHLVVIVFMRGLLKHLLTRMYFPDEAANADDPVLNRVPADRRLTLVGGRAGPGVLEWNIVLQGQDETVFFDF
jgi:protocatechuate 3,4-dioxygenase, alpha subunit